MSEAVKCPKCGSTDLMFSRKKQLYICEDCSFEFKVEKKSTRRIYISYGHDEYDTLAGQMKNDLEAHGHEIWYDPERTRSGTVSEKYLDAGLDWASEHPDTGRFIVLLTPNSVRRPNGYSLDEIAKAVERKLPIIPIMISWCEPPLSICRIQWLEMIDCVPIEQKGEQYRNKLRLLLETIEGEKRDYKGIQSRLLHVLEPLPFDADIQKHLERFTGRQWIFKKVDAWLADPEASRIFWIIGPPGSGKSAISAWLAYNRREVAVLHMCKHGHAQKADPRRAILSIAYQLSTQLPDYQDRLNSLNLEKISREPNVKTLFDTLITQPLSGNFPDPGRMVVVLIDALDEATTGSKNELADLVASEFGKAPRWLRLIITSRPEPEVLQPLQGLTPYKLDTSSPENDQDIKIFLSRELKPYAQGKELPAATLDTIAKMSEGIFLYVEWIRQELAQNRLSLDRLNEFPKGLTGVYTRFFTREYPDVTNYEVRIRPPLEIVTAALEPLTLGLLAAIFKWDEYDQADFVQELGTMFPITDGKLQPFHRSVIDWLTDAGKATDYYIESWNGHIRLSSYGWQEYQKGVASMPDYMKAHLPAHLIRTSRWSDVNAMMTDLEFFNVAWRINEFDVRSYWSRIEEGSAFRVVDSYRPIVEDPAKYDGHNRYVADLLYDKSHFKESLQIYDYLIRYFKSVDDFPSLKDTLDKKGMILGYYGEVAEAMKIHKEEEEICHRLNDKFGLQNCYVNQFQLLISTGDWDSISKLIEKMDSFCDYNSKNELSKVLHVKAFMLYQKGDLDGALKLFKEKEKIDRERNDFNGLFSSMNNQGFIHYYKGEYADILRIHKELERMSREQGHLYYLRFSLSNQSDIYHEIGNKDEAIRLLLDALKISRDLGHKMAIQSCLGNLAIVYQDVGELGKAIELHNEEIAICRETNLMDGLSIALVNFALIYYDRGMLDVAMRLLKDGEKIARDTSSPIGIKSAISNEALVHYDRDELDEAMRLRKEEEDICRKMNLKRDLHVSLCNQADIFVAKGELDTAMRLYEEAEQAFRDFKYVYGVQACLNGRALILIDRDRQDDAMTLLKEAEDICRNISYPKGLQASLGNQAVVLYDKGDTEGAMRLLKVVEGICRQIDYKEGLATALIDQAIVLTYDLSQTRQGLKLAKEACDIVDQCGIKILAKQFHPILSSIEEETSHRRLGRSSL